MYHINIFFFRVRRVMRSQLGETAARWETAMWGNHWRLFFFCHLQLKTEYVLTKTQNKIKNVNMMKSKAWTYLWFAVTYIPNIHSSDWFAFSSPLCNEQFKLFMHYPDLASIWLWGHTGPILADFTVSNYPHVWTNDFCDKIEYWYWLIFCFWSIYFLAKALSEKVFGNGLYKVRCWHEDPDGAEDGEEWERHKTKPVDDRRSKFPLVAHGLVLVLVTEAFGNKPHLVQDFGQLWFHGGHWGSVTCGEEHLLLTWSSHQPSTEDAGVRRGGGCGVALQATDADVQHVAVVGLGGWGAGAEFNAGQAAAWSLVVTGWTHSVLTGALHPQEPGAPVQQDHTGLWEQTTTTKARN